MVAGETGLQIGGMRVIHDTSEGKTGGQHEVSVMDKELSMPKAVCSICGKNDETRCYARNIERYGSRYDVYFCERCGVGFTVPFPSSAVLSRLYASGSYRSVDGTRFNSVLESLVRFFTAGRARKIRQIQGSRGDLLDIGCGRGLFLDIMKKDGWRVTGVEFNEETASYAKTVYEIEVITPQAMMAVPDESYDVITLFHVLEHMQDPAAVLRTCSRLLKKHGLIVIAVPNISSLQAKLGKATWFHLDIPYHLHHFTLSGLRRLLSDNALKVFRVQHVDLEQNIFGWLQSMLNASGIKYNLLYNLLKQPELRRSEFAAAGRRDVLLTILLTPIYLPLSIVLSFIESLILRRGGTIHLYASKQ
jgi:2-polyprenyl-3-methyl-5-hydroxy-6-metoxy-1,4-benzoquinol methylase